MNLIIVESPTKARTLSRFLSKDFKIVASMGHIRDLPKSKLGVDVKKSFKPDYEISKLEVVNELKKMSKKAKAIILAMDLDREGEAIAYHVAYLLTNKQPPATSHQPLAISRITFHEVTKTAIEKALKNPGSINMKLVNAQQARRILDRLVGYKLSPLLWRKIRRGLSAGRVQSVVVRLIVEREKEIEAFKPEEYWIVGALLRKQPVASHQSPEFTVLLVKINDKKAEVKDKKQADSIVKDLKKAEYKVQDVIKKEVRNNPMPPYITSTLQRAGANLFHWSSKKTMREAQGLYEAGHITYHRTDSVSLSKEAVGKVRGLIKSKYGREYLPEAPRFFKTKSKLAQEAHEAIRPTKIAQSSRQQGGQAKLPPARRAGKAQSKTGRDGEKLYRLIFKRFVACQMAAEIVDRTTIFVDAENAERGMQKTRRYLLKAIGKVQKFEGWRVVYNSRQPPAASRQKATTRKKKLETGNWKLETKNSENWKLETGDLPDLEEGEVLQLIKVLSEQKFTQPPARYTEASLIKMLESLGIGRPSTYAPTISTIQIRKYVEKKEGKFYPTPVGETVTNFLIKYFADIMDYQFTAEMEGDLDKIAQGKRKWMPVISDFYKPFNRKVKEVIDKAKRVKIAVEKTGKKCPECKKGEIVIRIGRFGKFLSCSRFPKCKYTENYVEKIGMKCPNCKKGDVIIRKTKKGRQFYGCSRYPKCKWASWRKPK